MLRGVNILQNISFYMISTLKNIRLVLNASFSIVLYLLLKNKIK